MGTSRSKFTTDYKNQIIDEWHAGEPGRRVAKRHGFHPSRLSVWARELGRRKRDDPQAIHANTPPPRKKAARDRVAQAIAAADGEALDAGSAADVALDMALDAVRALRPDLAFSWGRCSRILSQTHAARRQADAPVAPRAPQFNEREPFTPHAAQKPPDGDWDTWLFLGGRGAGKARAGAEWLSALATANGGARLALVGPALHDVREVMVDGPSGLARWCGR